MLFFVLHVNKNLYYQILRSAPQDRRDRMGASGASLWMTGNGASEVHHPPLSRG